MSEDNTEGNVATLEEPLVEAREEAMDQGDNLSADGFAQRLLADLGKEEPKPDEEGDSAGESAVEENRGDERNLEEEETGEAEAGDEAGTDLLAKYGIDLGSMSEPEIDALGRAIGGRAVSRFGELTRKRKEAEERSAELEKSVSELRAEREAEKKVSEAVAIDFGGPLSDVQSEADLSKEEEQLNALIDWVEESLESDEQYDDDGNTYLVEGGKGEKFSRQDLIRLRTNARKSLRRGGDLDNRRGFLEQRQQADAKAATDFAWLDKKESDEYKMFVSELNNPAIGPLLNAVPGGAYYLGLMIEGKKSIDAKTGKPVPATRKPDAPIAASAAAPSKGMSSTDEGKARKALDAAQKRFDESGSMNDLASLRVAQARLRSIQ